MPFWIVALPVKTQDLVLKPIIDFRERFERRVDRDLASGANDNRSDLFGRYRAGVDFKWRDFSGKLVYQVADDEAWAATGNLMTERRDVLLAYAERKVGDGTLTVGRQRLKVGSERLLGESNWNNISIAQDIVRYRTASLDFFAGKNGVAPRPRDSARLAGGSYRQKGRESFVVFTHDSPGSAPSDRWTFDHWQTLKFGGVSVEVEGAYQAGNGATGKVDDWALASKASYPLTPKLTAVAEGNLATDNFDVLYPSIHGRHGIMDLQGWRNAQNLGIGLKYRATKAVELSVDWRTLALRDSRQPWFGSTGAAYRRPGGVYADPTGNSGRDLGREVDFEARWQAGHGFTVAGGIGLFHPGRFVRNLGGDNDQTFGYFEVGFKF